MKNTFRIMILIIVMFSLISVSSAQSETHMYQNYCGNEIVPADYMIVDNVVKYCGKPLLGAVTDGFMPMNMGFARDIHHAYFMGKVIANADPATFEIIDMYLPVFSKDAKNVYCENSLLTTDVANFALAGSNYAKDSKFVYWKCTKLENSDPGTFINVSDIDPFGSNEFFKDKNNVYYQGNIVKADKNSFKVLDLGYAKDTASVFFKSNGVVAEADSATFQVSAEGLNNDSILKECGNVYYDALDKTRCYAHGKVSAIRNGEVFIKPKSYFTDVDKASLNYLYEKGIFTGYPDKSFGYNKPLTRAELLKIVMVADGFNSARSGRFSSSGVTDPNCFSDVHATDWYAPYVCVGKDWKYIDGNPDGSFKPNSPTNKVEALKMISGNGKWVFGADWERNVDGILNAYTDVGKSQWYFKYVKSAIAQFYMDTNGSNRFGPNNSITRGEAAEILFRTIVSFAERSGDGFSGKDDLVAAVRDFLWKYEASKG